MATHPSPRSALANPVLLLATCALVASCAEVEEAPPSVTEQVDDARADTEEDAR